MCTCHTDTHCPCALARTHTRNNSSWNFQQDCKRAHQCIHYINKGALKAVDRAFICCKKLLHFIPPAASHFSEEIRPRCCCYSNSQSHLPSPSPPISFWLQWAAISIMYREWPGLLLFSAFIASSKQAARLNSLLALYFDHKSQTHFRAFCCFPPLSSPVRWSLRPQTGRLQLLTQSI